MKEFIDKNCLTVKGGLNNRIIKQDWWERRNLMNEFNQLHQLTADFHDITLTQRIWHVYHSIYTYPECIVCKKPTKFRNFTDGFYEVCSQYCSTQNPIRNRKIVENSDRTKMVESVKRTCLERYGVESTFQIEQVKNKIKKTKLERYGDEKYNNTVKNKETCLRNWGSEHYWGSEHGKQAIKDIITENRGSLKLHPDVNAKLNNIEFLIELNETMCVSDIAEHIGVTPKAITDKFKVAGLMWKVYPSKWEKLQGELHSDITKLTENCVTFNEHQLIKPKELDIVIHSKKLAIELNGMYWHSFSEPETKDEKNKHLHKMNLCNNIGYKLLQFTDKEYKEKKDIVLSIISNSLGINCKIIRASKCIVTSVNIEDEKGFLNENHIQGYAKSSIKLGLMYDDELVYLMTFSKPRFNSKYQYELVRAASKLNYKIHGAASKVFSHFIEQYNPSSVISYCDRSKFDGSTYLRLSMTHLYNTNPNYQYIKGGKVLSRYQAQKHKLSSMLDNFDPTLSESVNMFNNGYKRYWDCGNSVFLWKKD